MSKDPGIERVTVSLPTELLQVLDELGRNLGHKSRSETVRAATRDYIAEHRWGGEEGWRVGVMMLQYNHHNMKIVQQINRLKGRFRNLIRSSLYISIS
ncbi:MAG: CopG family ribbon-helix-helix protein, partial [Nitrososphaerales archaeon]